LPAAGTAVSNVSFSLPLEAAPSPKIVRETVPDECDDGEGEPASAANPEADPGFLCIFNGLVEGDGEIGTGAVFSPAGTPGAGKSGALLIIESTETSFGGGSFAVTAP
jgi:hypothetical protein